jgi:hypothetical protein
MRGALRGVNRDAPFFTAIGVAASFDLTSRGSARALVILGRATYLSQNESRFVRILFACGTSALDSGSDGDETSEREQSSVWILCRLASW